MEEEKKPAAPATNVGAPASAVTVGASASATVGAPASVDATATAADAGSGSAATESSIFDELLGPMIDANKPDSTSTPGYFSTLFPTPAEVWHITRPAASVIHCFLLPFGF